jgi:alpha-beta hydrolase superfamily lysophospholipase
MVRRSKLLNRVALAVAAYFGLFASVDTAHAQTAFYRASAQDLEGAPGTLIRQEPMLGAPDGASAYRVLYRSTNPKGAPIAVSGIVIVPSGPAPAGGRPIVAWAHPTTGIVPHCAPSLAFFVFQQIQGSRELLAQGYAIAATDYPGLGTPGPHPYLVGASEARAAIDSVRAARALPGVGNASHYAVWGHSQGGQAALFTGIISKSYAPELQLVGVAAAAPATDLATLMRDDLHTTGGNNLTAMTLWSWARVYGAPIEKVVLPGAMPAVDQLAQECIESVFDILARGRTGRPLEQSFLSVANPAAIEPWKSLLAANTPGVLPRSLPIFIAQGTTDALVRPEVTRNYVRQLCKAGSRVRLLSMPNVGHGFAGRDAAAAAVEWMTARFAGQPVPNDCGSG